MISWACVKLQHLKYSVHHNSYFHQFLQCFSPHPVLLLTFQLHRKEHKAPKYAHFHRIAEWSFLNGLIILVRTNGWVIDAGHNNLHSPHIIFFVIEGFFVHNLEETSQFLGNLASIQIQPLRSQKLSPEIFTFYLTKKLIFSLTVIKEHTPSTSSVHFFPDILVWTLMCNL